MLTELAGALQDRIATPEDADSLATFKRQKSSFSLNQSFKGCLNP